MSSTLDEVTVYPGSALVTRRARTNLAAGEVRLLVEGLTPSLLDDSVRVQASGSAKARILGISVEAQPLTESSSAPLRAAEEALRELEDRDRELLDQATTAGKERDFLDALRSTYAKEQSENLGARGRNPKDWAAMVEYLGKEYTAIQKRLRRAEADRRELAPKLDAARADVSRLRDTGALAGKRVVIDLVVAKEGVLTLELGYRVLGASWRPAWDARLDPATGKVELDLQAVVEQRTGEDWRGVTLAVSTARPEQRIFVGELEPLYLRKAQPVREKFRSRMAPAPSMSGAAKEDYAESYDVEAPARFDVGVVATTVTATAKASVPSTGEERKSPLGVFSLDSKLARVASPRLDERAYLVAEATNGTGVPLFAGPVELFVGGAYAGRSSLADVPPGGELKLAFGPDPRIRLDRKVLDRSRDESGLFSKTETIHYRIRTTVKNHHDAMVELLLRDLVPVSQDEDIAVTILSGTTAPEGRADESKPGVKSWTLKLGPGEERAIELRYAVSYPKGQAIDGLP
ncbi:hypothetical protein AKJ08_3498 [Vulgatibacter incomptus]|uniref:Aspartate ammonia-lyase n=1 Tax=Vulgatibacter incomptus TaxID=1391653 RepID=A0A0K1PI65_9BACT|nr:hypothetical protein AKJ08_3498 [Vulgatibacter incomptus]